MTKIVNIAGVYRAGLAPALLDPTHNTGLGFLTLGMLKIVDRFARAGSQSSTF